MINIPAFRRSLQISAVPQEGIVISNELGQLVLGGALEQAVFTLINGVRSSNDIADALADRFPRENVYNTLASLERQALTYDKAALDEGMLPEPLHHLAGDLKRAQNAIAQISLGVLSTRSLPRAPSLTAFANYGLRISDDGPFLAVFSGDYLDDELDAVNRDALKNGRAWMLVKPVGTLA